MELRHLRYFVAVAETENMALAARRLRVAQSALSRQIQDLERELDAALFERHGRGLRLSRAGATLLTHARSVLLAAEEAARATRAVAQGQEGIVRVAPPDVSAWLEFFGEAVERFRAANPGVSVDVAPLPWTEHLEAVRAGRIDAGLTFGVDDDIPSDILAVTLGHEPINAAMLPRRHALATAEELTLDALHGLPMALAEREVIGVLHDLSLAAVRAGGYEPRVVGGMRTFGELAQFVATNGGWALVASCLVGAAPHGTVIRPVRDVPPVAQIGVFAVRRRGAIDPHVDAFVAELRRGAPSRRPGAHERHEI